MTEILVAQVKRKCNITWDDIDTNDRLTDIIQSAIPVMLHKLGIADPNYDFGEPGIENNLFKSYCFYEWNHCVNEFDINYANDIAQARAIHAVEYYEAMEESDGET
jgi:hypothetical protein